MRKLSLLLMIGTFLTPWSVKAEDCKTAPDCEALGFTVDASKCSGSALKCPWDTTKAACKEKGQEAPLPILYGDGTVTKEILSDKTPIGVVFDETNKLAVALTTVIQDGRQGGQTMYWSKKHYDIPDLENCTIDKISEGKDLTPITCGVDGRANTDKILACGSSCDGTQAATAASNYRPTGCTKDFCQKTKWFLPSLRDLQNMYIAKDQLDATLTSLHRNVMSPSRDTGSYWSSTEANIDAAWLFSMYDDSRYTGVGGRFTSDKYSNSVYVRPVVNYGESKPIEPDPAQPIEPEPILCQAAHCTKCVDGSSTECEECAENYILNKVTKQCLYGGTGFEGGCNSNHTQRVCYGKTYCCLDSSLTDCSKITTNCFTTASDKDLM